MLSSIQKLLLVCLLVYKILKLTNKDRKKVFENKIRQNIYLFLKICSLLIKMFVHSQIISMHTIVHSCKLWETLRLNLKFWCLVLWVWVKVLVSLGIKLWV